MTSNDSPTEMPDEHRTFVSNTYGLDEETAIEGLLDEFARRGITTAEPNEPLVDALVSGIQEIYLEESDVPVIPEALDEAMLPAALAIVDQLHQVSSDGDVQLSLRRLAEEYHEALLYKIFWRMRKGDEPHAKVVFSPDDGETHAQTTEAHPMNYLGEYLRNSADENQNTDNSSSPANQ